MNTDTFVLVHGVGLQRFPAPLQKLMLECGLAQGEVKMAVCPALPIEGITAILGHGPAGSCVWADVPPPVCATSPSLSEQPGCVQSHPVMSVMSTALGVTPTLSGAVRAPEFSKPQGQTNCLHDHDAVHGRIAQQGTKDSLPTLMLNLIIHEGCSTENITLVQYLILGLELHALNVLLLPVLQVPL